MKKRTCASIQDTEEVVEYKHRSVELCLCKQCQYNRKFHETLHESNWGSDWVDDGV